MAQLTWRNVDAPNMSSSMQGIGIASNLLSNATDSMTRGLESFGRAQQQRADNSALQSALQYTDPAAYQEALKSGAILGGVDTAQMSRGAMASLGDRSGQLINNAGNQQRQDIAGYTFDRTKGQNANTDAARQSVGQYYSAQQNGSQSDVSRILQENAGVLGNMTPEEQAALYTTGGGLRGKTLNNAGQEILNTGYGLDNTGKGIANSRALLGAYSDRQSAEDQRAVTSIMNDITGSVMPGDSTGALTIAESSLGGLSPNGVAMLRQAVEQSYKGAYSSSGSGSTPTVNANPYDAVFGNGKYGAPAKPLSQMTIGEVQDFGANTLIPATRGKVGA